MSAILSASGKWRIGEDGLLVVESIKTQKLEVGSAGQPAGVTIYDQITGEPKCVVVAGDVVKAEQGACDSTTLEPSSPSTP